MKAASCQFTAYEQPVAHECKGCIFEHERMTECEAAEQIAKRLDLPMCEDRAPSGNAYIYVLTKSDPRQLRLTAQGTEHEA